MKPRRERRGRRVVCGQSAVEYVLVTAVLAMALGLSMATDDSVLKQLVDAFSTAYRNFSFSLALPG